VTVMWSVGRSVSGRIGGRVRVDDLYDSLSPRAALTCLRRVTHRLAVGCVLAVSRIPTDQPCTTTPIWAIHFLHSIQHLLPVYINC